MERTDTQMLLDAIRDLKEPPRRTVPPSTLGVAGLVLAILPLIITVTAYVAPLSDEVTRIESEMDQLEGETLNKDLRLSERIDRVNGRLETSERETQTRLAQILADLSVIKSQIAPNSP